MWEPSVSLRFTPATAFFTSVILAALVPTLPPEETFLICFPPALISSVPNLTVVDPAVADRPLAVSEARLPVADPTFTASRLIVLLSLVVIFLPVRSIVMLLSPLKSTVSPLLMVSVVASPLADSFHVFVNAVLATENN